jgi:predicted permease
MTHGGRDGRRVREDLERDVRDEISHHLEETVELLVAQGWEAERAVEEARRRFGPLGPTAQGLVALQRTRVRRSALREGFGSLAGDVRVGMRGLVRNRLFAASVVATVALAAGPATTLFSVLDAVLLRPLPYAELEELVEVHVAGRDGLGVDAARYRAWVEAGEPIFEGWAAYVSETVVRTDGDEAEPLAVLAVTPGAERVVGIPLLHGRGFTADDARSGEPVALLTRGYFERLGADPRIVGQTLRLGTGSVTIIGVLERGFLFPDYGGDRDLWVPLRDDLTLAGRTIGTLQGVWARLRDNVPLADARIAAAGIAAALEASDPRTQGWAIDLIPLGGRRASTTTERSLWLLSATVALIFMVAVMNSLNLMGMRALSRARDLRLRIALGASRARLRRQLVVEGLLLGACCALGATALAWAAMAAIERLVPEDLGFFSPYALGLEQRALVFALSASLVTGALRGLMPGAGQHVERLLLTGARDDSPRARKLRSTLVVGQVALSTILLAGGMLFLASFVRLARVDPGFDFERLAQAEIQLSSTRYPTGPERAELLARLEETLEAHPSVVAVTSSSGAAFTVNLLEGEGGARTEEPTLVPFSRVDVDYLEVTGTELVAGRTLDPADEGRDVAIVDADMARQLWGTERAAGRRFRMGEGTWLEVVGVARDLRMMGRDQRRGPAQFVYPRGREEAESAATVLVRTADDPRTLLPVIRDAVRTIDPAQPIWRLRTSADALAEEEQTQRFLAVLMVALAGMGVLLAAVGVFGVLGYSVQRREREMGVRKALGAQSAALLGMVLRDGIMLGVAGIVLGIAGTLLASDLTEGLLYEVSPRDPRLFAAAGLLFVAVIACASLLPARRATRVDPVEALRAD